MSSRGLVPSFPLQAARAGVDLELAEALDALPGQSQLGWPLKLALSRGSGARMVAELVAPRPRSAEAGSAGLGPILDQGKAWLAAGATGQGNSGHGPPGKDGNSDRVDEVREALDALGWRATETRRGSWTIQHEGGQSPWLTPGGRGFVSVGSNDFVCFSQPPALLLFCGDECGLALATLALEANERLQLARTSIEAVAASDAVRACWQAVVPIGASLDRMLAEALAATWVARESTLAAYRALTTPTLARAYLATFNLETFDRREWSSVETAAAVL